MIIVCFIASRPKHNFTLNPNMAGDKLYMLTKKALVLGSFKGVTPGDHLFFFLNDFYNLHDSLRLFI